MHLYIKWALDSAFSKLVFPLASSHYPRARPLETHIHNDVSPDPLGVKQSCLCLSHRLCSAWGRVGPWDSQRERLSFLADVSVFFLSGCLPSPLSGCWWRISSTGCRRPCQMPSRASPAGSWCRQRCLMSSTAPPSCCPTGTGWVRTRNTRYLHFRNWVDRVILIQLNTTRMFFRSQGSCTTAWLHHRSGLSETKNIIIHLFIWIKCFSG